MATLEFKTNIKCGGCIATVTPHLNEIEGITWEVDTDNPDKILRVEGEVQEAAVMAKVKAAGFEISPKKKKKFGLF
jgi:copper chaperone